MKLFKTAVASALLALLAGLSGKGLAGGWKPGWKVGEWWKIELRSTISIWPETETLDISKLPTVTFEYRVVDEERVNGRVCFAVEQKELNPDTTSGVTVMTYYYDTANLRVLRTARRYVPGIDEPTGGVDSPPRGHDYVWTASVPFIDANHAYGDIPAFPLAFSGPVADSLSQGQAGTWQGGYVSQTVKPGNTSDDVDFSQLASVVHPAVGACYLVLLPTSGWGSGTLDTRQVWVPGLPWFLYSQSSEFRYGRWIVCWQRWLADWSGRTNR